jgi:hypothetical protein
LSQPSFEAFVADRPADDQRAGTRTSAAFLCSRPRRVDHARIVRESEIIIRREVDQPTAVDVTPASRMPADGATLAQQALLGERFEPFR